MDRPVIPCMKYDPPKETVREKQEKVARELLRIFQDDGMYDKGEWEAFGPDTHDFLFGYAGRILSLLGIEGGLFEAAQPRGEASEPQHNSPSENQPGAGEKGKEA